MSNGIRQRWLSNSKPCITVSNDTLNWTENYALQRLCFNCLLPEVKILKNWEKKLTKLPNDQIGQHVQNEQNDQNIEHIEHVFPGLEHN